MTTNSQVRRAITIITQHFQPSTGATAQLITDLSHYLAHEGHIIQVLTATPSIQSPSSKLAILRCPYTRPETGSVLTKSLEGAIFSLWCIFILLKRRSSCQLLLIVSNPPFIGIVGLLVKALRRQNYIFVLQDLFPRSAQLAGILPARGPLSKFWSFLIGQVCTRSSKTVVLSDSMKCRCLKEFSLPEHKVKVIHNWAVETALPVSKALNPVAQDWQVNEIFTVQYSGNFGRLHEIITLLEAARILSSERFHFLFVGGGSKKTQITAYINHFNLSNVTLKPYQDRSTLPFSLGACDISAIGLVPGSEDTVAPSKFYGIISSGKPILLLARHSTDIARLIVDNNCGFVLDPGDPVGVADTLRHLSSNPDILKMYSKNASHLYSRLFGRENSCDQYSALVSGIN